MKIFSNLKNLLFRTVGLGHEQIVLLGSVILSSKTEHRRLYAKLYTLKAVAAAAALILPWSLKYLTDILFSAETIAEVFHVGLVIIALFLFRLAISTIALYCEEIFKSAITYNAGFRYFTRILRLGHGADERFGIADFFSRETDLLQIVETDISLSYLFISTIIYVISVPLFFDRRLFLFALILIAASSLVFLINRRFGSKVKPVVEAKSIRRNELHRVKYDALKHRREYNLLLQRDLVAERLAEQVSSYLFENKRLALLRVGMNGAIGLTKTGFLAIGIAFAAYAHFYLGVTIGEIVGITGFLFVIQPTIDGLAHVAQPIQEMAAYADRIAEIWNHPPVRQSDPILPDCNYLAVRSLSFTYKDSGFSLKDISFDLKKGESLAIVGPSGSGKSTLAKILTGILDKNGGTILFDDHPIETIGEDNLAAQVYYLDSTPQIFNATIAENVCGYGQNQDLNKLGICIESAQLSDLIASLPDKTQTAVGKTYNQNLSLGQAQRLHIARSLYFTRSVVVYDESTSGLDLATEQKVVDALAEAFRNNILIVISHRFSTVRHLCKVLSLEEGRQVEFGSTAELLADENSYVSRMRARFLERVES